jgi:hypothetical protein
MERNFLSVLILALIAGPLAAIAISANARTYEPDFDRAPPLTISASQGMSAAQGVRFTSFDADGCAFASRAVIDENGRARTVNELFCKH